MAELDNKISARRACDSADEQLRELVHVISTQFNGDTTAYFNSLLITAPSRAEESGERAAIRYLLRSMR